MVEQWEGPCPKCNETIIFTLVGGGVHYDCRRCSEASA